MKDFTLYIANFCNNHQIIDEKELENKFTTDFKEIKKLLPKLISMGYIEEVTDGLYRRLHNLQPNWLERRPVNTIVSKKGNIRPKRDYE